jgi:hypothetical protein
VGYGNSRKFSEGANLKMNKIRLFALSITCAATLSVLTPNMNAGLWDKRTIVTFSGAVEVPGTVLQPGRYVMKLVDSPADRHIVQISNERENHVFATVAAVPAWREQPSGHSIFTFYEVAAGQPQPMKTWFYPGDNFGQEFVYSKDRLAQLRAGLNSTPATALVAENREPVKAVEPEPEQTQAPALNETPAPEATNTQAQTEEPVIIAQNNPPPAPSPEATPAPAPLPETLPKTSSDFWEIGLIGLGSIITAGGVRILRRN